VGASPGRSSPKEKEEGGKGEKKGRRKKKGPTLSARSPFSGCCLKAPLCSGPFDAIALRGRERQGKRGKKKKRGGLIGYLIIGIIGAFLLEVGLLQGWGLKKREKKKKKKKKNLFLLCCCLIIRLVLVGTGWSFEWLIDGGTKRAKEEGKRGGKKGNPYRIGGCTGPVHGC